MRIQEWTNRYNSFNSLKCLVHVKYWEQIKNGVIPPPIFVSIDPMNICNFGCKFCNADYTMSNSVGEKIMSIDTIDKICGLLSKWKTRTVCIGGGGESLLNDNTAHLIRQLHSAGIKIGMVTNGSTIDKFIDELKLCEWVGVSIDSSNARTYSAIKGVKSDMFDKVISNIKLLIDSSGNKPEVTYKFLVHPSNFNEIFDAASLAKSLGCNLIHIRPGGDPWFDKRNEFGFTEVQVNQCKYMIEDTRKKLEDNSFKVYGVMHKFTENWNPKKTFSKCYAIYTTMYISPNGAVGLCCDRRGDKILELSNIHNIEKDWGSQKHIDLINSIIVETCPRCTYSHVNEIFENVIIDDKMLYDFI